MKNFVCFGFGWSRSVVISGLWKLMDYSWCSLLIGESFSFGSLVFKIFTSQSREGGRLNGELLESLLHGFSIVRIFFHCPFNAC
jgi:hypothetical protein